MGEAHVHILEEQPRATIAHSHLARGLRYRAGARNAFEQFDLTDPDGTSIAEIDPKSHCEWLEHEPTSSLPLRDVKIRQRTLEGLGGERNGFRERRMGMNGQPDIRRLR